MIVHVLATSQVFNWSFIRPLQQRLGGGGMAILVHGDS